MKRAVGCDIEEIKRFENKTQTFLDKIFTGNEQAYCLSKAKPSQHFAVRFCAKEAVVKALTALGERVPPYREIEILNDERGVPYVVLTDAAADLSVQISLSHSRTTAMAVVAAELPD